METTARQIARELHAQGHIAYFAGGCVRDLLRGEMPKDFDIATDASPEEVQKIFRRTYAVGAAFGVIVVLENESQVEVATFRSDGAYLDGRRPSEVHFSSAAEDARRRDFTINGMFFDPVANEVIDYVEGRSDLEAKRIRAIGDPAQRFAEDRLRLLRAVRFATILDFEIAEQTWVALKRDAGTIGQISAERIRDELNKIFLSSRRVRGWDLLDASGLLPVILPEVEAMKGCQQPPQFHPEGDVFQHTRLMLELLPPQVPLPLLWSVILHDVGKPVTAEIDPEGRIRFNGHDRVGAEMTERIMDRLRFSRAEIDQATEMVRQHMVFKDVPRMRLAKLKRFMARPTFKEEMELHRVDCTSSHGMLDNYEFLLSKQEEFAHEPIIPKPLVRGDDLIALGLPPGPRFKEILDEIETRQLEGTLQTREEALAWLQERL
ncbi:MAG: CCA tRNA nucleotidyltransferase [Verrucomicrobiota bacterium]